jgi:hypothetical protein
MSTSSRKRIAVWAASLLTLTAATLRADQLQMQNGDRYAGKIISVTSNTIVLESDVLGRVTLPRDKVLNLRFGPITPTNTSPTASATNGTFTGAVPVPHVPDTNADLSGTLHHLGANTNFIQQVRQQMLAGADPAASRKYDELVSGLLTGKLSVDDIRNEAKSSIDQINELKKELGPQADESLDSYLSILQSFVNETAPAASPAARPGTNSPPATGGN